MLAIASAQYGLGQRWCAGPSGGPTVAAWTTRSDLAANAEQPYSYGAQTGGSPVTHTNGYAQTAAVKRTLGMRLCHLARSEEEWTTP